jgi:hypothetical protein
MTDEKEGFCDAPKNLTPWGSDCLPALTVEQIQAQAKVFLAQRAAENKPLTAAQRAEIHEANVKAMQEMFDEFSFSDNAELVFLKRYLKELYADEWDAARRLEFINELITWAFDDSMLDAETVRKGIQQQVSEKEEQLRALTAELEFMKKSLDKEFK